MGPPIGDPDDRTLTEILAAFELEGYRGQMAARPGGRVLCVSCHMESDAAEMEMDGLQRVEGVSDPADMLVVAALVCPVCNTHGTLVLGYGPDAGPDDAEVLAGLGDIPA
ncbi:MAG: hypothetical protein LC733_03970 [Actinobacteria bacterium]|nr:hypothetical protein [Actinomycetota bacterium]